MFGYLPAPCRCHIGDQVDVYRSAFCGLCNSLAAQYGQPARLLINRDTTFVALLAAAQTSDPPAVTFSARCQPWRRPVPVFESGPIPAFAAGVTLCGLQAKLDDERADERGLRAAGCRALSALSRTRFDRARGTLAATVFPVDDVSSQLAGQSRLESLVAGGGDAAEALRPTARAFGSILAHTARLAGIESNVRPLDRVGRSLGGLIYTLDAYQDLEEDRRRSRFNFLAAQTGTYPVSCHLEKARSLAGGIASGFLQEIGQAWQEVRLFRYRPVLEAVLLAGLSARTGRILGTRVACLTNPGAEERSEGEEMGLASGQSRSCDGRCCETCYYCDCSGCDCSGCHECCQHGGQGTPDCSGCDCSGCDCQNCDCSGCDCSGCDCGGCDCNC